MSARIDGGPAADAQPQARHARRASFSNPRTRRTCVEHQETGGARHRSSDGSVARRPGRRRLAATARRTARHTTTDNLPGKLAKKQAETQAGCPGHKVLKGEAKAVGKNQVVKVAKGQFVELAFEGEDQILTLLGEFGRTATAPPGHPAHTRRAPARCTTRSRSRIVTVDNSTIWAAGFQPGSLRQPALQQERGPVDGELLPRAVLGHATASTATSVTGSGPEQRGRLRQQLLRRHRLRATRGGS